MRRPGRIRRGRLRPAGRARAARRGACRQRVERQQPLTGIMWELASHHGTPPPEDVCVSGARTCTTVCPVRAASAASSFRLRPSPSHFCPGDAVRWGFGERFDEGIDHRAFEDLPRFLGVVLINL